MTELFNNFVLVLLVGFLPTMYWLWFWLEQDKKRPEPRGMIIKTFLFGLLAIIPAGGLEKILSSDEALRLDLQTFWTWPAALMFIFAEIPIFLLWSTIEESIKLLAAWLAGLSNKKYFDEPIDAVIYLVTAALGFSAGENILYLYYTLNNSQDHLTFILTGNLRFLGATLLHAACSAIIGIFIAYHFTSSKLTKTLAVIGGLATAIVLHSLFNLIIMTNNGSSLFTVLASLWFLIIVILLVLDRINYQSS